MGRIADMLRNGTSTVEMINAAGSFPREEIERLNAAWRAAGFRSRAEFIAEAVMDAVEAVETAKGGAEKLLAAEVARKAKQAKTAKAE